MKALEKVTNVVQKNKAATFAAISVAIATNPTLAWATDASNILDKVKNLLSGGVGMLGAAMVVFGAVNIGTNVGGNGGVDGSRIAGGVATLIGGVIIAAAALYFGSLDTAWVNQ